MPPTELSSRTVIQACSGNMTAEIQSEMVLLQTCSAQYFGLNEVAARIWQIIQAPTTVSSVVEAIANEYSANWETVHTDVLRLLVDLQDVGLVRICT